VIIFLSKDWRAEYHFSNSFPTLVLASFAGLFSLTAGIYQRKTVEIILISPIDQSRSLPHYHRTTG